MPETILLAILIVFALACAAIVLPHPTRMRQDPIKFDRVATLLLGINCVILVAGAVKTFAFPGAFALGVKELGSIAILQELFILVSLITLIMAAHNLRVSGVTTIMSVPAYWLAIMMVAAIAVLFLEEISYGQHYIGWNTPDVFANNLQNETNLHNFYTHRFEFVYYTGAFLCFCVAPLLAWHIGIFKQLGLSTFIPGPAFAIASMPITVGMFESWAIVPFQAWFLIGLSIITLAALWSRGASRAACIVAALCMLGAQCAFLVWGPQLVRGFEPTEIRELAISASLAAYGVWLAKTTRAADDEGSRFSPREGTGITRSPSPSKS